MSDIEDIKRLRDELIRRQSIQQQSKALAEQSINEIKELLNQLREITESNSELLTTYGNLNRIINLDADGLVENQEQINSIQQVLESIINAMQKDVEVALDV